MPDSNKQINSLNPFLDALAERSQDQFKNSQIMEISAKLDKLIDMLNPPKSAIITGSEVERVIKEIEKARGRG